MMYGREKVATNLVELDEHAVERHSVSWRGDSGTARVGQEVTQPPRHAQRSSGGTRARPAAASAAAAAASAGLRGWRVRPQQTDAVAEQSASDALHVVSRSTHVNLRTTRRNALPLALYTAIHRVTVT